MHKNITLAVFAAFLLCACAHRPPPIGRGGPRAATEVTSWFDIRVKQRFPVGSEEEKLRAELHREAFRIDEANDPAARYRFTASYQANGLACTVLWHIRWNSEQGRITDVAAEWGQTCL